MVDIYYLEDRVHALQYDELHILSTFSGKILDDAKQISEYKIEESKFIVAMVSKVSLQFNNNRFCLLVVSCVQFMLMVNKFDFLAKAASKC